MPTHLTHNPRRHPNPLRHPLKDRRNAPGIQRSAHLAAPDEATKYRPLGDFRMLQPNLESPDRLAREVCHPPLSIRIRLPPPNERLPGAVRMKIQVSDLQRHELPPPRERF